MTKTEIIDAVVQAGHCKGQSIIKIELLKSCLLVHNSLSIRNQPDLAFFTALHIGVLAPYVLYVDNLSGETREAVVCEYKHRLRCLVQCAQRCNICYVFHGDPLVGAEEL